MNKRKLAIYFMLVTPTIGDVVAVYRNEIDAICDRYNNHRGTRLIKVREVNRKATRLKKLG